MPTGAYLHKERKSDCHPERKHKALGLCRPCYNKRQVTRNPNQRNKSQRLWNKLNPLKCLAAKLRYHYGITLEDYEKLQTKQGNRCAICRQAPKRSRLYVDHDHKTGKVRGLLCAKCNMALGVFGDSEEGLWRVQNYLRRRWKS